MAGKFSGPIFTFQFYKTHIHTGSPLISQLSFSSRIQMHPQNLRPAICNPWDDVRACQKGANLNTVFFPHLSLRHRPVQSTSSYLIPAFVLRFVAIL